MNRRVVRRYDFSANEVAEALVAWMKAKDMPAPMYVGTAGTTTWSMSNKGASVEWTDDDTVEI